MQLALVIRHVMLDNSLVWNQKNLKKVVQAPAM